MTNSSSKLRPVDVWHVIKYASTAVAASAIVFVDKPGWLFGERGQIFIVDKLVFFW